MAASEASTSTTNHFDLSDEWRDWPGLPGHLLFDITDKLKHIEDYVSFGRVCTSWQNIFLHNMKSLGSPLLVIDPPDDEDYSNLRALYSLSTKSVCNFQLQLPHCKICRGSSFGWLITMEEKGEDCDHHIQLYNPFLSRTIDLPTLDNIVQLFPDEYIETVRGEYLRKAALSSDPSMSDDYIIMGIMSRYRGLAFFKPGNRCWMPVEDNWSLDSTSRFEDVIYFRKARQFYALLLSRAVVAIEFHGNDRVPKFTRVAPRVGSHKCEHCSQVYLVEDSSSGKLLQVHRKFIETRKDENGNSTGNTYSVMRAASDCPGCLPNHIYYTTEPSRTSYNPKKMYKPISDGIYNLEDGTIQQHYLTTTTHKLLPATIWLEPTFTQQQHLDDAHLSRLEA